MHLNRRTCLAGLGALAAFRPTPTLLAAPLDPPALERAVATAESFPTLNSLIVTQGGVPLVERRLHGARLDQGVNVKSVSKTWIATLVGIAIDKGALEGVDQPIAPLMADYLPADPDPRLRRVTVGHLLSMRAGLERTSGPFYGRWVASHDWVRYALSRPFIDEPGGTMLYSTGNSHILSALLTSVTGHSTHTLMRAWLGNPLEIAIPPWSRDPQGIFFGGNDMYLSPRALTRFGEMIGQGGVMDGQRIVSADWIEQSWQPQVFSPFTGHAYGYGWFLAEARGYPVRYAWGYGGQMLYIVPDLDLTVAMTSDPSVPSGSNGYARQLHALLANDIIPAVAGRATGPTAEDTPPSGAEPSGG